VKVFGVGLSRTGTTSFCRALEMVGFSPLHEPQSLDQVKAHDAACDLSVAARYKEFDGLFPGSKFVLTFREKNYWAPSAIRHYALMEQIGFVPSEWLKEAMLRIYGTLAPHKLSPERLGEIQDQHIREVRAHFFGHGRGGDLLIVDVCTDRKAFVKLVDFLDIRFPHLNGGGEYVQKYGWGSWHPQK
jgi:hypothetical protein